MQSGYVIMFYGFSCLIGGSRIGKLAVRYGRKKIILIGFGLFCGGGFCSMLGGRMLLNGTYQTIWLIFGICILLLIPITKKLKLE